jgi:sodium-dependent dicarboxylate transporter 2/3/5
MPQATDGHRRLATCLMLSIAYAASIGGISTLIGTPPNVAFRAFYEREVPGGSVDFVEWMVMAVPLTATLLVAAWALLCLAVFRVENRPMFGGQNSIASQRAALGPMQPAERRTGGVFIALAALWILREPAAGWGWAPMLGIGRATIDGRQVHWVDDSTVAMAMALVCFILPSGRTDRSRLLTWNTARRVPWEILLLFGGGLALAAGMSETGLDAFLGTQLQRALGPLSPGVQMAAVTGSMTLLTELTSNLASVLMILPILHSAAESLGVDPRSLMIPATIAASCAFMLPVATPPNAIVYGSGHVRIRDMIRAGVWMNLVSIVVIVLYLGLVLPR